MDPKKTGQVKGFFQLMMQLVEPDTERGRRFVLDSPSILASILLICKKEGDVYGKCKSWVILRYLELIVVQEGKAKHVYCLGFARLRCGDGVLA